MKITAAEIEAMIAAAQQRVSMNWTPPGATLNVLIAGDIRPLTTGALSMYLDFHSWLWQREVTPQQREAVRRQLTDVAFNAEWVYRDEVLTTCALWDEIQRQPEGEQYAIRDLLRTRITANPSPQQTPAREVARDVNEVRRESADTHNAVMWALQHWPKLPG